VGWEHRIVGQSIGMGTPFEAALVKDGIDATSVEGAASLPYDIPNLTVELHTTKAGVPVLWWSSRMRPVAIRSSCGARSSPSIRGISPR